MASSSLRRFAGFCWATLAVMIGVILWGAYVRASGSGAGCGSHWPRCDGEVLPRPKTMEMLVELLHRATSGVILVMVLAQLVWAFVVLPRKHPARAASVATMVLVVTEALVGAGIVLLEYVALDKSIGRAAWMSLHLINTFFLVAASAATAWFASGGKAVRLRGQGTAGLLLAGSAAALLLVGVTGAITALGDTLFMAASLAKGIADDLSPTAHFLQQLRVGHPVVAVSAALFVLYARGAIAEGRGPQAAKLSRRLAVVIVGQLCLGALNFVLLAPVAMQLLHLLAADLVWIAFVFFALGALASPAPGAEKVAALGDAEGSRAS